MFENGDLQVLLPNREITLNGEVVEIKPFAFGKIPKVIKQASHLIQVVMSLPEGLITEDGDINLEDPATTIVLASMLEHGGGAIFEILALAANKPMSWVEELQPDEGILLLVKVWEVNKDFFTRRLGPLLQQLKIPKNLKLPPQILSDGEVSSTN